MNDVMQKSFHPYKYDKTVFIYKYTKKVINNEMSMTFYDFLCYAVLSVLIERKFVEFLL